MVRRVLHLAARDGIFSFTHTDAANPHESEPSCGIPIGRWYLMQTDRWYLERRIYLTVGINISTASTLSLAHSAWWLSFTAFVGAAMCGSLPQDTVLWPTACTDSVPSRAWHQWHLLRRRQML